MTVPYTFGTATTSIPLSNLDANFNTPITLGNTSIYLGNTTTTIGNLTLTNATISSGTVNITNVTVTTANVTNITVTGTANIATGNITTLTSTSITDSGLTSGRVTFAGASGLLSDSANLNFNGTNLSVGSALSHGKIGSFLSDANTTLSSLGYGMLSLMNSSNTNNNYTWMTFNESNQNYVGAIGTQNTIHSGASSPVAGDLVFATKTAGLGGFPTEKMRIDSAGNVGVSAGMLFVSRPTGNTQFTSGIGINASNTTGEGIEFLTTASSGTRLLSYDRNVGAFRRLDLAGNTIQISPNNSTSVIVNEYGLGIGATTPSSGTGITFPATQNASSNANTLDDYEEGTWTPVLTNGTNNAGGYFYQFGSYIKVGRLVTINCTISVASVGSMTTGEVSITGLPFTSGTFSNANEQNILSAKVFPLGTSLYVVGTIGTSSAVLTPLGVTVGGQQGILSSNVTVGSQLFFTGTYWAAS